MDLSDYKKKLSALKEMTKSEVSTHSKDLLSKAVTFKGEMRSTVSNSLSEAVVNNLETIQTIWNEKAKPIIGDKIADDALVRKAAFYAYGFLPAAVRFILSEEKFIEFTLAQRDKLMSNNVLGISYKESE